MVHSEKRKAELQSVILSRGMGINRMRETSHPIFYYSIPALSGHESSARE
jgi:hypothetical protein